MDRKVTGALAVGVLLWFMSPILFGASANGVELNRPGEPPTCHSVHTYSSRSWPGIQMLRSDVWLTGCTNPDGSMRLASGPTCQATSFLGRGTALCTATPAGNGLQVVVHINYPFGINQWAREAETTTFMVDTSGYQLLSSCLNNQGC